MNSPLRQILLPVLAALLAAGGLAGCTDGADDLYARERAFLRFRPVTAVAPLYTALNSTGVFCAIRLGTNQFLFQGSDGRSATYPFTAEVQSYGQPECVAGFVVGVSSLPDLNMQYAPAAYDLVCPTCYEQTNIQRTLAFEGAESLRCPRCSRLYDLTNGGLIKEGDAGTRLYRYRISYSAVTDMLFVVN